MADARLRPPKRHRGDLVTRTWIKGPILALAALLAFAALPAAAAGEIDPTGVWLMEKKKVAIKIYQCDDGLCGRIVWLKQPLDRRGRPKRDKRNPDAAARNRPLCGIEVLRGLTPAGQDRWDGGTIYNPKDGKTYAASLRAAAADTLEVRGYVGFPLLGKTRTLTRAQQLADAAAESGVDLLPAAKNGVGQDQIAGLVDIDRGFGERQVDGPGCHSNQARQPPQRGAQG